MNDPYIQENGVLKNKLNILDYTELKQAEKDITFAKFLNISDFFSTSCNSDCLKAIHKHIFSDVFDWAGEYRTIQMYKPEDVLDGMSLQFSEPEDINQKIDDCVSKLNSVDWDSLSLSEKSSTFTNLLLELWKTHPFRDGNTRTTLTFAYHFSNEHNFPIDLSMLLNRLTRTPDENGVNHSIRDKFVLSNYFYSSKIQLANIFQDAMLSGINNKISTLQRNLRDDKDLSI